ncbi:DinB family protein [Lacinutrix sp. C3R15]|uniref:DinB family protein n=1 Tax=Flavobacteriaceae TaxID=49546 RepID=UPI001C0A134A|nr:MULTISPECIES: DinB family protein [Flavobacteriaceae]MBU2939003.1 DinB family protein [Lacinutrix sp. C3R15]MDO6622318.1 DinB family protein [Oceanihabitans sp. 1_MG-2023]
MPLKKLNTTLSTLESHIENHTVLNAEVSKSNIGWHIDHSLKVINNVIIALQKSDPESFKNNFSFLGKIFFTLGFFPRGKAKAPEYVQPPEVILKEDLISQLQQAKTNINSIANLDKNAYFKHPIFGYINKKRVATFLALHTNHHLKIMEDILKK